MHARLSLQAPGSFSCSILIPFLGSISFWSRGAQKSLQSPMCGLPRDSAIAVLGPGVSPQAAPGALAFPAANSHRQGQEIVRLGPTSEESGGWHIRGPWGKHRDGHSSGREQDVLGRGDAKGKILCILAMSWPESHQASHELPDCPSLLTVGREAMNLP